MKKEFSPHLSLAKKYWQEHLAPSDLAIDATCGNGHDTLFLAQICHVVAIDIQRDAIQKTESLLEKMQKKAILHCMCHAQIDEVPLPFAPKLIVYNLGYLPGGDKSLTTKVNTSLVSIKKSLGMLGDGGALSVMCYPGHEEGKREEEAILSFMKALPWSVCYHQWINRALAPSLFWVKKELS